MPRVLLSRRAFEKVWAGRQLFPGLRLVGIPPVLTESPVDGLRLRGFRLSPGGHQALPGGLFHAQARQDLPDWTQIESGGPVYQISFGIE